MSYFWHTNDIGVLYIKDIEFTFDEFGATSTIENDIEKFTIENNGNIIGQIHGSGHTGNESNWWITKPIKFPKSKCRSWNKSTRIIS